MDRTLRALSRFGLGARIGEARGVTDPRGWLFEQVHARHAAMDSAGLPTMHEVAAATTAGPRALLKGVITGVFDLTAAQAERAFPGSERVRPMTGSMG